MNSVGRFAKQEARVSGNILGERVVAQFALRLGARRRQRLGASLRVACEHVLRTDLPIEAAEGVQDILFKGVVGVLAAGGAHLVLGALLPLGEAAADGVVTVILCDARRVIQVVHGGQEAVNALVSVGVRLEHLVRQARRVDEEFCCL